MQKNKPADLLRHFRLTMGFSQIEMAKQLEVSRSLLSMAELNRRQLPEAANEKMNALYRNYKEILKPASIIEPLPSEIVQQYEVFKEDIDAQIFRAGYGLPCMRDKLLAMKSTYQHSTTLMERIAVRHTSNEEINDWSKTMKRIYNHTQDNLRKCGLLAQAKLQLKIDLRTTELEVLNRHLEVIASVL